MGVKEAGSEADSDALLLGVEEAPAVYEESADAKDEVVGVEEGGPLVAVGAPLLLAPPAWGLPLTVAVGSSEPVGTAVKYPLALAAAEKEDEADAAPLALTPVPVPAAELRAEAVPEAPDASGERVGEEEGEEVG